MFRKMHLQQYWGPFTTFIYTLAKKVLTVSCKPDHGVMYHTFQITVLITHINFISELELYQYNHSDYLYLKRTLGFVFMDDFESPRTVFNMILSRFRKAP